MKTTGFARALVLVALLASPRAGAFEFAAAVGMDNLRGNGVPDYAVEARTGPLWTRPRFELALGAAVEADDSDLWAGAGPVLFFPLGDRLRLEASVMLGGYGEGEWGNDLGTEFPMFRSQLGFSVAVAENWWLGLMANHKSNASTAVDNPGIESVLLVVAHRF
ncbi:acyloxyacyl hydrolase [Amaricoccus sp.]|uniref:acyloxyacyl hydrolase n=1 Tax=Amaricoccus sp. TaxID=1872485 RepID=UPI001B636DA6|nr:acyloxyacyl hydrolase [Amaricoccus sp.]MBP7000549.1 acyloxyacyl hydrolase [Amaricoccus sp.]